MFDSGGGGDIKVAADSEHRDTEVIRHGCADQIVVQQRFTTYSAAQR
jgi:hypothetical protein